jgi:hypothetical protein
MEGDMRFDGTRLKAVWGARVTLAAVFVCAMLGASCGKLTRQGTASSYLILTSLTGTSGAQPGTFSNTLLSDVITVINNVPSTFNDPGQAGFQLALKDPGSSTSPNQPTPNNFITITQYHVEYVRSDGHNIQGVDVPYAFDGAVTATVTDAATVGFTLVRHEAKKEAPLATLNSGGAPLTTIARVTFYGHDQTGREVSVTGNIEITFLNLADPT